MRGVGKNIQKVFSYHLRVADQAYQVIPGSYSLFSVVVLYGYRIRISQQVRLQQEDSHFQGRQGGGRRVLPSFGCAELPGSIAQTDPRTSIEIAT